MANIVIVEDIIRTRAALRELVSIGGHKVLAEFGNAEDALDFYVFSGNKADLILLDYNLKTFKNNKEYTGVDLLKDIIKLNKKAKVIFISAFAQSKIIKDAISNGAKDFIVKPYDSGDLLKRISKALTG